jgi:3'-5' exoribonuclease
LEVVGVKVEKVYVKDLKPAQQIKCAFLVKDKTLSTDKKGHSFLSVVLSDKTGQVDARVWDQAEEVHEQFEVDDFIFVKGTVQKFQNRNQVVIHGIETLNPSSIQISDFLPTTKNNIDEMFDDLLKISQEIRDPFIRDLILNTLKDQEIQPLIKKCPAAKSVHHAYIGGLLEHTLSICNVMKLISQNYKELNLDLLIFGAIFHDIGKIWELSFDTHIGYTDVGRLVGHISLGSELVERKAKEIPNFPVELKHVCKHLVLTHHGKLEYGSPKRPKFLEAMVVGMIDELDSRINSMATYMTSQMSESNPDQKWSSYNTMYDRYFYLDILKQQKAKSEK